MEWKTTSSREEEEKKKQQTPFSKKTDERLEKAFPQSIRSENVKSKHRTKEEREHVKTRETQFHDHKEKVEENR